MAPHGPRSAVSSPIPRHGPRLQLGRTAGIEEQATPQRLSRISFDFIGASDATAHVLAVAALNAFERARQRDVLMEQELLVSSPRLLSLSVSFARRYLYWTMWVVRIIRACGKSHQHFAPRPYP